MYTCKAQETRTVAFDRTQLQSPATEGPPSSTKTAPNHGPLALSNRNLDMCSVNDRRQIEDRCKSLCLPSSCQINNSA